MYLKSIAFDAYGTLFDVYSVSSLAEELFPGKGAQLATIWRDKQIEYTRLRTVDDNTMLVLRKASKQSVN